MKKHYFNQTFLPCVLLSALTGVFTGVLIFIFKFLSKLIIGLSSDIYTVVRAEPRYFLLLLGGGAIVGLISFVVVNYVPNCRGGGIPTAVAILRGHIPFEWMTTLVGMFASSIITFGMGVPLGNEGPSVQMGCAVGRGTVNTLGKKNRAWDKYVMTGGAAGGFAAATASPLSGILFAFEEVHKRISPIIFMSVSSAVITSYGTMRVLSGLFKTEFYLFDFTFNTVMPMKYILTALLSGVVAGAFAILFAKVYRMTDKLINGVLADSPAEAKIILIFVTVAGFGFISSDFTGSGHDLICEIMYGRAPAWYLLTAYLIVRALLLLFASTAGITGGIFIPSLTFGAMLGSLTAKLSVSLGLLPEQYAPVLVIVGMTAFLAASSKIPLTAIAFSLEALSGLPNVLPIAIGTAAAYILTESAGAVSLTDAVIESKIKHHVKGKDFFVIDTRFTVAKDSFALGKETRDVLLPPNCIIVSAEKKNPDSAVLCAGDVLHLRYKTYDNRETYADLIALFGKQEVSKMQSVHSGENNYTLPEI